MVQDYVSPIRVHKFPFEMVMAAYERRFPNCPQIPVVIECVIVDDSWSPDDAQRCTTRRCQLNVEAPYLLKKMIGVDYIYFIQTNNLDLQNRVLDIEATNETFASKVQVIEKCKYYVHPENPEWTCFEQSALLDVKSFFGLENTVEKIAMKQYASNVAKGKELIEVFMKEVIQEGITELFPWSPDDPEYNHELRRIVSRGKEPLSPRPILQSKKHTPAGSDEEAVSTPTAEEIQELTYRVFKESDTGIPPIPSDTEQNGDLSMSATTSGGSVPEHKKSKCAWLKNSSLWRRTQKSTSSSKFESLPPRRMRPSLTSSINLTRLEDTIPDDSINRPCYCEQTMINLMNRWDNLLMLLVCAMFVLIIMSSSAYFKRDRRV